MNFGQKIQVFKAKNNGTKFTQKQKDKKDTHKEKQKNTGTMHTHEYITLFMCLLVDHKVIQHCVEMELV